MTVQEWLGKDNKIKIDIWEKKYRYNNETFDEWLDRVSGHNEELKQLIKEKKFLFGGRVLSNRGLNDGNYFNCFSAGYVEDDYNDIMDVVKKLGLTYKAQGGQGISLSKLRPKGTPIGTRYQSDGIIPFMELYNTVTSITSQAGSRKGALLISLDIRHKEAEDFITIKTNPDSITKANLSLEIDDEFMQAVKKYYETGEEVVLHEKREYSGHVIEYDIVPIKLYKKMMECAYDWGEPGCIFTNEFRNYNLLEFDDRYNVETCNPCVTGDTLILTRDGYKKIVDVVDQEVEIWNGYEYSTVIPRTTGYNQDILHIEFSNGMSIDCTPYHKFILNDGSRVEAKELKVGDKLQKYNYPLIYGYKKLKAAYTQGAFSGDGFICKDRNAKYISLYGDKKQLVPYLNIVSSREISDNRDTYSIDVDFDKDFVPNAEYDIQSRLQWLAGLIDTDGTRNTLNGAISISSINIEFLKQVQYMLTTLGVSSKLSLMKPVGMKKLPSGNGQYKEYYCQTSYRLIICASSVEELKKLGLTCYRVNTSSHVRCAASRFITVTAITPREQKADVVYCVTEPKNHSVVFNGLLTSNCGEQPLKKDSCCNLGSLNLAAFVRCEYTDQAHIDYEALERAIYIAVRALDDIIDENIPLLPLEEHKESARNWRNIGLGVMGLGTALFKLQLTYGSKEALAFVDDLFHFIFRTAVLASHKLAHERGAFPNYSDAILKSRIMQAHFTQEELNMIHATGGLRNCSLLSIAPTGTISTLLGVTGGAEPEFAIKYKRKTDNLDAEYDMFCDEAQYYMTKFNTEQLPRFFVCASDIAWKDRIDMQATIQKHIDTAISSTVNLPHSISIQEVEQLYLYAWERRLKGVTIFRDGCKRVGILSTGTESEAKQSTTNQSLQRGEVVKAPDESFGKTYKISTGCGNAYLDVSWDNDGNIVQTFMNRGSKGTCLSNQQAISRLISLALRGGISVEQIIDQLKSVPVCSSFTNARKDGKRVSKGSSCPYAMAVMLEKAVKDAQWFANVVKSAESTETPKDAPKDTTEEIKQPEPNKTNTTGSTCPDCGESLAMEGGCNVCKACGWSKCS